MTWSPWLIIALVLTALLGVAFCLLIWGFFRIRRLDRPPVARGIAIEQLVDGVLVLDIYGRVADVNAAGAAIVGRPHSALVGRYAVDIVPGLAPLLQEADGEPGDGRRERAVLGYPALPASDTSATRATSAAAAGRTAVLDQRDQRNQREKQHHRPIVSSLALSRPGVAREVAVSLTAVTDPMGRQVARLVVLRDVTERNRAEQELRDLLDEQTRLSQTLQQSLRPASLPQLPGLQLAARSVPSGGGGVGGDFYDVHPAGDGRWAFVLGDVSGNGVHAAVVTSMARYTVRTLSAQGWSPGEVLEQLNRALQTPDDLERFCTVLYGHVVGPAGSPPPAHHDPEGGASSGVRLVLTLGGHPPPLLLRRRDRSVQAVGVPGTVLGLLPEVEVHEVTLDLATGDVLLAYTDGVTEARDGDEQFGEERLARVLAGVQPEFSPGEPAPAADPVPQLAEKVADAVLRAVREFSSERDDVALLVLVVT